MEDHVDHSKATMIFVLGLLSIVMCQLLGPIALIMGNNYKAECEMAGVPMEGLGNAGRVCGIVGTVLFVLNLVILGLVVVFYCCVGGAIIAGG